MPVKWSNNWGLQYNISFFLINDTCNRKRGYSEHSAGGSIHYTTGAPCTTAPRLFSHSPMTSSEQRSNHLSHLIHFVSEHHCNFSCCYTRSWRGRGRGNNWAISGVPLRRRRSWRVMSSSAAISTRWGTLWIDGIPRPKRGERREARGWLTKLEVMREAFYFQSQSPGSVD